jgi:LmbE family N-acetylglucosaminyl deacetylase
MLSSGSISSRSPLVRFTAFTIALVSLALSPAAIAQTDSGPRVLIVTAHPDDDATFAATVYKITHDLHGVVDLALVTNGEGGYKYSTLAESIYGLELTDEKIGRQYLPAIRKQELMAGGKIVGIRNYFFIDQQDHKYTQNVDSVLKYVWDVPLVKKRLHEIMVAGKYQYLFCLLPTPDTHGGHKGATILALDVVGELPAAARPIVLGGSSSAKSDTSHPVFTGLKEFPETSIRSGAPSFRFDRTQKFGFNNALDYRIIVNWLIAEHKSQGTMQTLMNSGDIEEYWFFDINDPKAIPATNDLFEKLKIVTFKKKEYH